MFYVIYFVYCYVSISFYRSDNYILVKHFLFKNGQIGSQTNIFTITHLRNFTLNVKTVFVHLFHELFSYNTGFMVRFLLILQHIVHTNIKTFQFSTITHLNRYIFFCSDLKEECCDRYVVAGGQTACFVCFLDLTLPYVKTECSPCTYNRMLIGSLYRHIIFVEYFSFLLKLIVCKSLDYADGDCKINPLCAATLICCNVLSNLWIKYQTDWCTHIVMTMYIEYSLQTFLVVN